MITHNAIDTVWFIQVSAHRIAPIISDNFSTDPPFRRILVFLPPLGRSIRSLKLAARLAKTSGAEITVVDVARELPTFLQTIYPAKIWTSEDDCLNRLQSKTDWLACSGIPFTTKVLRGRPAVEIVREIARGGHDLLIKDVGNDDEASQLFGSLDLRLMRNSPCAVWLVKPHNDYLFHRILAAIDPQATSNEAKEMNKAILRVAGFLADVAGADLHVVGAWVGPGETAITDDVESTVMRQYIEVTEGLAKEQFLELLKQLDRELPAEQIHFCHGHPSEMIRRVSRQADIDLVVMGCLVRTGIPGLLIGNTAENVLRTVGCSVLALKPSGFRSPMEL